MPGIHYALPENLLDWADERGLLIIEEAGNWQLEPSQMDAPEIRQKFMQQFREMVERDWNHPSIIAWSVGNEFPSHTPAGIRWVRDMAAFARKLDPTRLVTFASNRAFLQEISGPEGEGSNFVDFISINLYGSPESFDHRLDLVRQRWPRKPIFISEFGARADFAPSEQARIGWFGAVLQAIRRRPFIIGASVWTFSDYRSLYPGTNPDGYRHWGLVDRFRNPRGAYDFLRNEFAPVVVEQVNCEGSKVRLKVRARSDFPRWKVHGWKIRVTTPRTANSGASVETVELPELDPGQEATVSLQLAAPPDGSLEVCVIESQGLCTFRWLGRL